MINLINNQKSTSFVTASINNDIAEPERIYGESDLEEERTESEKLSDGEV